MLFKNKKHNKRIRFNLNWVKGKTKRVILKVKGRKVWRSQNGIAGVNNLVNLLLPNQLRTKIKNIRKSLPILPLRIRCLSPNPHPHLPKRWWSNLNQMKWLRLEKIVLLKRKRMLVKPRGKPMKKVSQLLRMRKYKWRLISKASWMFKLKRKI